MGEKPPISHSNSVGTEREYTEVGWLVGSTNQKSTECPHDNQSSLSQIRSAHTYHTVYGTPGYLLELLATSHFLPACSNTATLTRAGHPTGGDWKLEGSPMKEVYIQVGPNPPPLLR